MKPGVVAVQAQQLLVIALLDDAPLIQHEDAVALAHRAQTVGDNEYAAALANARHIVLKQAFGFVVQSAGGFIEDQNTRFGGQRTGNGQALALAAGEVAALFADRGVVALGQFENKIVGAGQLSRGDHLVHGQRGIGQSDVLAHAAGKKHAVL